MRRIFTWLTVTVLALALVSVVGFGLGGWYYSDQLLPTAIPEPPEYDVRIAEVTETAPAQGGMAVAGSTPTTSDARTAEFVLEVTHGDLVTLETIGLQTEDGLVLLEGEADTTADTTTRTGTLIRGELPRANDLAAASVDTYAGDPAVTLGLLCDRVDIASDLGVLRAWRSVPPGADTDEVWAVTVHGRGAGKAQTNRSLATTYGLGLPTLAIAVRNDPGAPAPADGYGRYGSTEWRDLQAAITHLREAEGAERFVLIGYSQGASIVLTFLRRSPDAGSTDGAVLVSPLISLHETLVLQAEERDIPELLIPPLVTATRWIATYRSGMDFTQLEHLDRIDEIPDEVEFLVTHGDADRMVPVVPSRAFAEALPNRVVYEEYDGVGHVREWNAERDRFEADLRDFLVKEAGL